MRVSVPSLLVAAFILFSSTQCLTQSPRPANNLEVQAQREFADGQFTEAERDFREIVKRDPTNIYAQMYLGQSLFRQEKYAESVLPYEKAGELEKNGRKLTSDQHRILIDQLAMAYGISGDLKKAHALLESAIRNDPEYPMNYYNLACAYAEEDDKEKMLTNLSLSFQHKDHLLMGEQMPDPRSDSSFRKYVRDKDFMTLMTKLGYK